MNGIATGQRAVRDATPRLVYTAVVLVLLQGFVPVINAWAAGSGLPAAHPGDSDNGSPDLQSGEKKSASDKQAGSDKDGSGDKQGSKDKAGADAWKNDDQDLWSRFSLLGDIGGLRAWMLDHGVTFGITETSEILGNVTGSIRPGAIYEGVTSAGRPCPAPTCHQAARTIR